MKIIITVFLLTFMLVGLMANTAEARTSVRGSFRSNGTYVAPHYRTSPNSNRYDNWSAQGNYNPYTGKKGYTNTYR